VKGICANSIRLFAAFCFFAMACPALAAQEPQFDDLAKEMSEGLVKSQQFKVAVTDFFAADEFNSADQMDDLGRRLADDFRAALLRQNHEIVAEDRATTMKRVREHDLVIENLRNPATVTWLFEKSGVDAWVSGELSSGVGGLKVTTRAYRVGANFPEYEFETSIPLTEELKALIHEKPKSEFPSVARAGVNGVGFPSCIYCPQADYDREAAVRKLQGTVELEVTIDEAGEAQDIRVKVGLPYGLTRQAIDAVKKWRFRPADGPDGKPVAVRQGIKVTFHLY
jgi:TonB family protein